MLTTVTMTYSLYLGWQALHNYEHTKLIGFSKSRVNIIRKGLNSGNNCFVLDFIFIGFMYIS